jgi:hypothetical protein
MANLQSIYKAIKAFVIAYPGGVAGVFGVVVALAARFGFHLTVTELMSVYAVAAAIIGAFVHVTMKAVVKDAIRKDRRTYGGLQARTASQRPHALRADL